jgi:dienelactone hydrolase
MQATGIFHDYSDGETVFEAYIGGARGRRLPTVLLAHEWSGLNARMRGNAERVADLSYVCFAIDVYGKGRRGDGLGDSRRSWRSIQAFLAETIGVSEFDSSTGGNRT